MDEIDFILTAGFDPTRVASPGRFTLSGEELLLIGGIAVAALVVLVVIRKVLRSIGTDTGYSVSPDWQCGDPSGYPDEGDDDDDRDCSWWR